MGNPLGSRGFVAGIMLSLQRRAKEMRSLQQRLLQLFVLVVFSIHPVFNNTFNYLMNHAVNSKLIQLIIDQYNIEQFLNCSDEREN